MAVDVGLSVREGVANGLSPFKEPAKRNIGLLGGWVRGTASPVKVTSLEEFNVTRGGQSSSFFGPRIVKSIFDEAENADVTLYIARVIPEESVVASASVALRDSGTMEVMAGYRGEDDPGSWANSIGVDLYSYGSRTKDMYTLIVSYKDDTETYEAATLAEIQNSVNKVSKYITIVFDKEIQAIAYTDLSGTISTTVGSTAVTGTGTQFLTNVAAGNVLFEKQDDGSYRQLGTVLSVTDDTNLVLTGTAFYAVTAGTVAKRDDAVWSGVLSGGEDGELIEESFYPVESKSDPKGLALFHGYDVQIIACTEFHTLSMAKVLNQFVAAWGNPIGIVNLPLNADETTAELWALELQTNSKSFLVSYLGWCTVPDELGNGVLIPVMGPVLGAGWLRTPYIQGDFIHIPPAGIDSLFSTVIDMIPERLEQGTINKMVQQFSCNYIAYVENTGYYVGSSRTYSTNSLYMSAHIRLQTSYYVRLLNVNFLFAIQKPNTPELKREILVEGERIFRTEYDNGALERSITFDQAYEGICDRSNNPLTQDRKLINAAFLFIPTECTESLRIDLLRNDGILTTIEA